MKKLSLRPILPMKSPEAIAQGLALRQAREARNIKQETLAAKLGVSKSQVSRWEAGERPLRLDVIDLYAYALDCPVRELLAPDSPFLSDVERREETMGREKLAAIRGEIDAAQDEMRADLDAIMKRFQGRMSGIVAKLGLAR